MNNEQFLQAIFGTDLPYVHVTDFTEDPNNIPTDQHLIAWRGNWFSRYKFRENSNQYFTISIFNPDEKGIARRRKALYLRTPCIVLDDVREKLDVTQAEKLPEPSWVLETSPGSEQWGYILEEPCADRGRVENLLDGLVANGLAPEGRDPGMKGVTRYVRLPDGVNTKASKLVDGKPFKCRLLKWQPFVRTTMEEIAAPFAVNLDAIRREGRVDGAADIPDHPLLQIPDLIYIKEVRSNGRFDITCPWVEEHTGEVDNGTAIFTNQDGSMGFKCHHGACEGRTGKHLLEWIEEEVPGFTSQMDQWKKTLLFRQIMPQHTTPVALPAPLSFIDPPAIQPVSQPIGEQSARSVMEQQVGNLSTMVPGTKEREVLAETILKASEDLEPLEQKHFHDMVCDIMKFGKTEFNKIIKSLRKKWYSDASNHPDFYKNFLYVKDMNRLYEHTTNIFYTTDGFRNSYMEHGDVVKVALEECAVPKVDRMDFAPNKPLLFMRDNMTYGNLYNSEGLNPGKPGDVKPWLEHMRVMGFTEAQIDHIIKWMAFTIQRPEHKINHMILLGGNEGVGKDFIITPLIRYMNRYAKTIDGYALLSQFNSYLIGTKLLIINETELFDHKDSSHAGAKLKPIAAAPPDKLMVNQKGIPEVEISNVVNGIMTTNKRIPLKLDNESRRFFALWSELDVRNEYGQITTEWARYFSALWDWMNKGGCDYIIHHLRTEVDINEFMPGEAPPMTDFLRDITDSSKPPSQQALEYAIKNRIGLFDSDMLTPRDIATMMQAGHYFHEMIMFGIQSHWFSPVKCGKIMSEIHGVIRIRARKNGQEFNLCIYRNREKYADMSAIHIYEEYEKQLNRARTRAPLQVVKENIQSA